MTSSVTKSLTFTCVKIDTDLNTDNVAVASIFKIRKEAQEGEKKGHKCQQESLRATKAVCKFPVSNLIKVTNKPINTLHSMSLY